jgi:ribosome-associated protein
LAKSIAKLTLTKKAADVVLMDLRGLTSMTDFFVVCSADSDIQVKAIADAVEEGMERKGVRAWHTEGGSSNWILLDYVDVVLHVFHRNLRQFYSLEKLWGDAKMEPVQDEQPARRPVRASRTVKPAKRTAARKTAARWRNSSAHPSPARCGAWGRLMT